MCIPAGRPRRPRLLLGLAVCTLLGLAGTTAHASIVSDWNSTALTEVRASRSLRNGPPIVARTLAIAHTCMYDAWAAYDDVAVGTTDVLGSRRRPLAERTDENKAKAVSFAAYLCLRNLFPDGSLPPSAQQPSVRLNAALVNRGYDLRETCATADDCRSADPSTPEGLGNVAAQAVIDARRHDGSNQYGDAVPVPCPLPVPWAMPCAAAAYGQNSAVPLPPPGAVWAYADHVTDGYEPYLPTNPLMGYCNPLVDVCERQEIADPNHWQPLIFFNGQACLDAGAGNEETCPGIQVFIAPHWERVTPFALTSADQFDQMLVLPPPDYLKNPGHYAKNVEEMIRYSRNLNEARKLVVEYWADGPSSELPPGHWGLFAQFVSQRDGNTTDQDAKMFFAMHNASFDAGIVGWHIKRKYNGVRPITAIRFLKRGMVIRAWGGPGRPIEEIPGEKWSPYNPGNNLTPSFPGYFSGHSVFSRSSATVLRLFTGSDVFGFSTVIPANFGRVEPGIPSEPTTLSYPTFDAAANDAGLSRLYGGIHFSDDNTTAQAVGLLIGQQAWEKAQTYFNGTAGQ
jgi:PAP2 superfamily